MISFNSRNAVLPLVGFLMALMSGLKIVFPLREVVHHLVHRLPVHLEPVNVLPLLIHHNALDLPFGGSDKSLTMRGIVINF